MKRILLGLLIGLVGIATLTPPARALKAPENDDVFDVEAYNGAREDNLEVQPLGHFFPAFDFNFTFNFDVDVSGGGFFGGADSDVSTDLQAVLEPLFTPEEQFQKNSSQAETPRANISLSTVGIEPGSQVAATAQPQNYRLQAGGEDLFYAWALDSVSLSGVAAGADSLDLPQASSPRGVHTREPETDADGDGIDDEWEVRYGLDPTSAGDAGQDPDQDGYTNDVYQNEAGETLLVEPATSAGEPGGALTNLKEYIWGTDPTNPDTDGDGYSDGQDIAGLGQMQISVTVPPDASVNDAPILRLTILGHSIQEFSADEPLVKLDSTTLPLTVRDAEKLDVRIDASTDAPVPGEPVTLTATLGRTDYQPGILNYTWFVNSVPQQEGSGQSKFTFTYTVPESAEPGDLILFAVTAVNFETRQQAEAQLEVRVGELMQLQFDPQKVESGKDLTVSATLVNNSDPTELVFHWMLDDHELEEQSGQGKTSATFTVPKGAGEEHEVALRVTTPDDSAHFAESSTVLTVNTPRVDVVLDPAQIALGGVATAVAVPEHFSGTDLQYLWSVDGVPLESETTELSKNSVELSALETGEHTVSVVVRSVGPGAESAEASAVLTVTAQVQTTAIGPDNGDGAALAGQKQTVASVRQAIFGRPLTLGIFFGTFFVALGIVTLLLIRRNALS